MPRPSRPPAALEEGDLRGAIAELEAQRLAPGRKDLRGFEWSYLWRLCHSELWSVRLAAPAPALAFSPDGKTLAIAGLPGGRDGWSLLEADTGRVVRTKETPGREVLSVAFSPDGRRLAWGDGIQFGGQVSWLDLSAGEPKSRPLSNPVDAVAFSPDGRTLAATSRLQKPSFGEVTIYDPASGREIHSFDNAGHNSLVFSPTGRLLAATSRHSREVSIWETGSWERRRPGPAPPQRCALRRGVQSRREPDGDGR